MAKRYQENKATPISPKKESSIVSEVSKDTEDSNMVADILGMVNDGIDMRSTWGQKMEHYYKMRMRVRRTKTFPFNGCSNLRMPTVEKYLRKIKASLFNVVWGIKPHALVVSEPNGNPDVASKLEYYIDWLLEVKMRFSKKLVLIIDKMLDKGFSIAEPIWKMEDEKRQFEISMKNIPDDIKQQIFSAADIDEDTMLQSIAKIFDVDMSLSVREDNMAELKKALDTLKSGKEKVTITLRDETYNNVEVLVHDPEDVFVPVDSGIDPQECRFVAYEVYEPWDVVKRKAQEGVYDKEAFDMMEAFRQADVRNVVIPGASTRNSDPRKPSAGIADLREGIMRAQNSSKSVKLWRIYAWYDCDGDGIEERNVFIAAPEWKKILTKFPFPYAHKKWPCVRFDSEIIDDRWYSSRGVSEMIEDLVKEIDTQHNQKIDQQTIRNAPMFAFRPGVVNPRLVKFIPGQAIPVNGVTPLNDAVSMLNNTNTNAEFSYRDEEMMLKMEIQEIFGQTDFSMQSVVNRRQPRTAAEVMAQQQSAGNVFSLDSLIFGEAMSDLLTQIVQLTQQYLPDEVFFSVVGEGGSVRLTRDEIQGQFIVRVRGNDITSNPQKRLEMAQAKIAFLMNQYNIQTGIITPPNVYLLLKEYLQDTGDFNWSQKISVPQPPPPPQPPPAITNIKTTFDELTDIEQAQVLASAGIKPDMHGRLLEKQQELMTEMGEQKQPQMNGVSGGA